MTSPDAYIPPPDLSAYVDLRPFDVSDQEIVDTAIAAARLNLPGWVPREGHAEVMLIESLALEIAEAIVAVNRLPGAVVQAILLLAGVDRDYGAAPVTSAIFEMGDTLGHEVPGGTRLYLPLDDGSTVTFLVEPPGLSIPAGQSAGTVSIIGDAFTASANGVQAGNVLVPADPLPFIESVTLGSNVADGRDPETDDQWRDRGVARLSRLSDALVLPRHFEAAAIERPEVSRAVAIDLFDPTSGTGVPGDYPGHITVAVLGPDGTELSPESLDAIEQDLEARAVAILDVHVINVAVVAVDVGAEVHLLPGMDAGVTIEAIEQAIRAYLSPLTWQWGGVIRRNELISLVDRVEGVDYVIDVSIDGQPGDHVIPGATALPIAGEVSVTST